MAQTNYTPIYLYNSGTATNTPLAANLGAGELAINYTDGKLFYKDNNAAIQVIGWKTTPTTAGGTGLTSYTAGDLPYYATGSALSKLGIGTANYVLTSSGTAPQYVAQSTLSVGSATNATNTAITDNTSSSSTWYPTIVSATTGNLPQTTSSTKLSFIPSTGELTAVGGLGGTPTFSYYNGSTQTVATATFTKILFATSEWDTTSGMYASSKFTPTVAGYYLITGALAIYNMGATGYAISYMYKNGSAYRVGNSSYASATQEPQLIFSSTVYLNGSTDYIEIYCYQNTGTTASIDTGKTVTFFQGSLIRGA